MCPDVLASFCTALGWWARCDRANGQKRLEALLGADVHQAGELALQEEFGYPQRRRRDRVGCTVATVQVVETPRASIPWACGIHGDLFAFSERTGALRAGTGILASGRSDTDEELGYAVVDFGQHRSATSQSAAWKVSRWRSRSRMDSRPQFVHRQ